MIEITLTAHLTCDKCGITAEVQNVPLSMVSINWVLRSHKGILNLHSRSWKRYQCDEGAYWDICGECVVELASQDAQGSTNVIKEVSGHG